MLAPMKRGSATRRVLVDLLRLAWEQRRWWLLPMVAAALLVAAALMLGSSPAAPFVYTFF